METDKTQFDTTQTSELAGLDSKKIQKYEEGEKTQTKPDFGGPVIKKTGRDLGGRDDYSMIEVMRDSKLSGENVYASVFIYPQYETIERFSQKRTVRDRVHFPKTQSSLTTKIAFDRKMPTPLDRGFLGHIYWYNFDNSLYDNLVKIARE